MRRASSVLSVLFVTAVLLAFPATEASGVSPEDGAVVRVELDLKATNGLVAHLENSEDGTVTLELRRRGQHVTYETPGKATEDGLKVRFGRLGSIDVAFIPTKTLDSTEPGPGCTGAPRTLSEGVYAGMISFAGERGVTRIEGPRAHGSMSVISQWTCPEAEANDPYERRGERLHRVAERKTSTLIASRRGCSCYFVATVNRRHSIFGAILQEEREGMKIERTAFSRGPVSAFAVDPATGRVTLRPPPPLRGRASFEERSNGRGIWRSSIRVPLLGAAPIDTGAPGFVAAVPDGR